MTPKRYKVQLTLEGPVLTAATNPAAPGIDAPFARNRDGRPCFPGTLIKGKLLQSWQVLHEFDGMDGVNVPVPDPGRAYEWLGREAGNEGNAATDREKYKPSRGRALFKDFVDGTRSKVCDRIRSRIAMDEALHAADEGALEMMESPYGTGEPAVFEGTIDFFPRDDAEAADFASAVRLGLSAIPAFGAERGAGFGKLRSVTVDETELPAGFTGGFDTGATKTSFGLSFTTSDPLCFARPQPAANLFESSEVISGAVIKGAVAEMMGWRGDAFPRLKKYLSHIRFRHARPVEEAATRKIPPAISLSTAFYGDRLRDMVLGEHGTVLNDAIPEFQPDWKYGKRKKARDLFGIPEELPTELRLRTSIDKDKRRAKDEMLFGYESVMPEGFRWLANVDLFHVPEGERGRLLEELHDLLRSGLFGVGKNKALLRIEAGTALAQRFENQPVEAGKALVIQLQTPALLGRADAWQEARTAEDVLSTYQNAWQERDARLHVKNYFAQQELAGGYYLHRRFGRGAYQPWVLTTAGSVFVFEPPEAELQPILDEWLVTGLPLEAGETASYGLGDNRFQMWERCPYVPENGFGEIGVNLHRSWKNLTEEADHA
jgi:hypothetical protein